MDMRAKAIGGLIVAVLAVGCVPGVDLSQLRPGDGGSDESETVGDGVDLGDQADAVDGDADAAGADGDGPDGDGVDHADAVDDGVDDASDVAVGPPARVWGELTTSGAAAGATGCAAHATGFCLRSDSVDSAAEEMTGGGFRLRGIVVGGGLR